MLKKFVLAASLVAATAAPAFAAPTLSTELGSTTTFAAPTYAGLSSTAIDFNGAAPAGFTLTLAGAQLLTGSSSAGATPAFSDGSRYLSVLGGTSATLQSSTGYSLVSFYLGSIDTYNSVDILSVAGTVIDTYTGVNFTVPANGNQSIPSTNRRVTYQVGAGGQLVGGIRFRSDSNSAEIDNVVFAVPEPTTWAMMLAGFGMIGFAMRSRRRRTNVVYA